MASTTNRGWHLTRESLARLLARLDPDPDKAAAEYEVLRGRLVEFFDWRNVRFPEDLADQTIDRMASKLADGEDVGRVRAFAYGVARKVHLEWERAQAREEATLREIQAGSDDPDAEAVASCLDRCLERLPEPDRTMILGYYGGHGNLHDDGRKWLAARLGVTYGTLKTRTHRIRARLWCCLRGCLKGRSGSG
jgi:DNA-directed RNA polymerase specialized sigma24 family protein